MGWMSRRALVQEGPKDRSADGEFFQEMTERLEPLLSSQTAIIFITQSRHQTRLLRPTTHSSSRGELTAEDSTSFRSNAEYHGVQFDPRTQLVKVSNSPRKIYRFSSCAVVGWTYSSDSRYHHSMRLGSGKSERLRVISDEEQGCPASRLPCYIKLTFGLFLYTNLLVDCDTLDLVLVLSTICFRKLALSFVGTRPILGRGPIWRCSEAWCYS